MEHKKHDIEGNRISEQKREEAHNKRKLEEKTYIAISVILYSVFLVFVVIAAYVGVKLFITAKKNAQAVENTAIEEVNDEETVEEEITEEEPPVLEEEEVKEEEILPDKSWQDTVFSRIENPRNSSDAPINTFKFLRLCDPNSQNNALDYAVYKNPENDKIEKITSTENCGDLFEIIDYYYDDGKINYISQYTETVNIPVNISTADVESRYYFRDGSLVKYIYCENGKATEYSYKDLKKYSEGTKGQYEYMEDMMLDKAEHVWDEVKKLRESIVIEGYVLDEFNQALMENPVILIDKNGNIAEETTTNGDGFYSFTVEPDDEQEYTIRTYRDTLDETNVYGIVPRRGSKKISVPTIYMAYTGNVMPFQTQVFVKDADTSENLTDANIRFRYGLNCKEGDSFLSGNLGEYGYISPQLRSGNYTAEVRKDGYETLFFNFTVKTDHQAQVAFAVKKIEPGEIKAVLSWEANPLDLNIKCFSSNAANTFISIKDSVGSTDAEVIDILNAGDDAYYFFVSDLTNIAIDNFISYSMFESIATVTLYNEDGFTGMFVVPAARGGVVWKPIEIRAGKVLTINDYFSSVDNDSVFKKK